MSTIAVHSSSRLHSYHRVASEACDPDVFHLSLRGHPQEVTDLHSFGYLKVPHIGVYGANYHISQPLVLLSLPATTNSLMLLPADLLESLQFDLSMSSIAKELVVMVLQSALRRLGYNQETPLSQCYGSLNDHPKLLQESAMHRQNITSPPQSVSSDSSSGSPDSVATDDVETTDKELWIRLQAKKIVRKALHLACKRWEHKTRRCSIDDLIASTKKLKISESPTLSPVEDIEKTEEEEEDDPGIVFQVNQVPTISIVADNESEDDDEEEKRRKLGKKRPRSESHDAVMLRELSKFQVQRKTKSTSSLHNRPLSPLGLPIATPTRRLHKLSHPDINHIVSSIQRMSIIEVSEEGRQQEIGKELKEEEFIELEAITKPYHSEEDTVSCDTSMQAPANLSWSNSIDDPPMDYYIMVHSLPPSGVCQKFLCSNTNEVNLVYHCWLYQSLPLDPSLSVLDQVEMGVFQPSSGVLPVHQNLADAGVAFGHLEPRSVCIHNCCFSPENAQLQLISPFTTSNKSLDPQLFTFFSAARHNNRKVIAFHVLPSSKEVELCLRQAVGASGDSLAGLVTSLSTLFPHLARKLKHLLIPFM